MKKVEAQSKAVKPEVKMTSHFNSVGQKRAIAQRDAASSSSIGGITIHVIRFE